MLTIAITWSTSKVYVYTAERCSTDDPSFAYWWFVFRIDVYGFSIPRVISCSLMYKWMRHSLVFLHNVSLFTCSKVALIFSPLCWLNLCFSLSSCQAHTLSQSRCCKSLCISRINCLRNAHSSVISYRTLLCIVVYSLVGLYLI